MNTKAQIFPVHFTTPATHLTGVTWIDLPCTWPSIFSFVRCELNKLTPGRIGDGFRKTMILEHSFDVELFKNDDSVLVHQFSTFLMGKISALVGDSLMNVSYYFSLLAAFWTALLFRAQFALCFSQSLFIFAKESLIFDCFTIRQYSKF